MSNNLARVERVAASDARFAWAKNIEFAIFGLENDFADDVDIAAGRWCTTARGAVLGNLCGLRATHPSTRSVY